MPFPKKYDSSDPQDILRYAKWLIGKSFYDVLATDFSEAASKPVDGFSNDTQRKNILEDATAEYGNLQRKGGLGNLIEEHFFHYGPNSNPEADFSFVVPHAAMLNSLRSEDAPRTVGGGELHLVPEEGVSGTEFPFRTPEACFEHGGLLKMRRVP